MAQTSRSAVVFCEVCGSAVQAGETCPDCNPRPTTRRRADADLARSLGIVSLVLGLAAAAGVLHLAERLAPLVGDAVAAIIVGALPALLGALFGAAGLSLARRSNDPSWPYAAGGLLASVLALLIAVLMTVEVGLMG